MKKKKTKIIFESELKPKKTKIILNNPNENQDSIQSIQQNLQREIYFYKHAPLKLFELRNIYPNQNKFHLEIHIKDQKNQNQKLIQHLSHFLHQYPSFLDFMNKNMNLKKPLKMEMYYTKELQPILLIQSRGFHFLDFLAFLDDPTITLEEFRFVSTNEKKIF